MTGCETPLEEFIVGHWNGAADDKWLTADLLLGAGFYAQVIGRQQDADDLHFCASIAVKLAANHDLEGGEINKSTQKIGFAKAVRTGGDYWQLKFYCPSSDPNENKKILDMAIGNNSLAAATSDTRDFHIMCMCERFGRFWQKGAVV